MISQEIPYSSHIIVMPHLRVQNANAISSPLTHGFPSITAFMGLMWALERRANAAGINVLFNGVGVICHNYQEQVTQSGFTQTFNLTRNPVDKSGQTAPIVEEGRIHLDISVLFAVEAIDWSDDEKQQTDIAALHAIMQGMRLAGGSFLAPLAGQAAQSAPWCIAYESPEVEPEYFKNARYRVLPGFALVERSALITQRLAEIQKQNPQATALDAWLSLVRVNWHYNAAQDTWQHDRTNGWVVPIPVGYGALGAVCPPGTVAGVRDATVPFQVVESLFSLGEWVSPLRLKNAQDVLWYPSSKPENGVYRCHNFYRSV
ncbi:type I-F CRISPR-associated protein Csy2 [Acetobacter orientalis]|uniref:type I-F CRISPR-associated protein Csy2 n=1 Tax=Acetobacter orientalis TaxID=146474 RepID=UPI0020A30FF9|nr:type I-F CRISPR-associated protein Csy2 [Acetobacter orientalis]MCP1222333.1 type I-F CRISPR-associated protein Csy2 [Acetobacter orientalis]